MENDRLKFLEAGGELGALIRAKDWSKTVLGPPHLWPPNLQTAISICLRSKTPMQIWWGRSRTFLYNDATLELLGLANHPQALGACGGEAWPEMWEQIVSTVESVGRADVAASTIDLDIPVSPRLGVEKVNIAFSFSPLLNEGGAVEGLFCVCSGLEAGRARSKLAEALRVMRDIHTISSQLIVGEDADTLFGAVLDAARSLMRSDMVSIQCLVTERQQLFLLASQGFHAASAKFWEWVDADSATSCGAALVGGEMVIIPDVEKWEPLAGTEDLKHYRLSRVRAVLSAPLISRNGALVGIMSVHWHDVHEPSDRERRLFDMLARQAADLLERRAADAALRESEERFHQFAEASADGLWIRDAKTLTMEYVSPAIPRIYGAPRETFLGDMSGWSALIVPEDRYIAMEHIAKACGGESVVHEFRIQRPSDLAFRWIRNTDFPLLDSQGKIQRIGGIAEDITEEKLAIEYKNILLSELQHRVRNIIAIIQSIAARTGENATTVAEYTELMAGRLRTFAHVQTQLTRAANVGVELTSIVQDEISAQAVRPDQYTIKGAEIVLPPKSAEVLTLAIHELTTNALKYGPLSRPTGHITVSWAKFHKRGGTWLGFDWNECDTDRPPADVRHSPAEQRGRRRGFGSELIEARIPYELSGKGELTINADGAQCHLEFPLDERASILETDAPRRTTIYGGALDMTGETQLTDHRTLIVEDDYFLAHDTARALQGAGAEVLGPCPTEEGALALINKDTPTSAVVDVNLGYGPSFKVAEELLRRGIPFVLTTGYGEDIIPAAFAGVPRFQKPVRHTQVVNALATAASQGRH